MAVGARDRRLFQLTPEVLLPFQATLEKLQAEAKLARQAALLTGFNEEMLAAIPFGSKATVQNRRWPDLWARAMMICTRVPPPATLSAFTGQIHLFGVELREHGFYASAVFHGIALRGAEAMAVRVTLSTWKVDVVFGSELWKLFSARAPTLVKALTDGLALTVDALPLAETGDMAWDDAKAALVGKLDLDAMGAHLAPGAKATRTHPRCPSTGTPRSSRCRFTWRISGTKTDRSPWAPGQSPSQKRRRLPGISMPIRSRELRRRSGSCVSTVGGLFSR